MCLALQLKDGQQHSLLTGICVGVRMGAHEHTAHVFFFLRERRGAFFSFFFFMFGFVCVCMCAMLVVDLTYVWCSHMFVCLYHCVMRESFFSLWF